MSPQTIAELRAESKRYKDSARKIDELIEHFEAQGLASNYTPEAQPVARVRVRPPTDWANLPQAEVCFMILSESAKPLTRQEIVEIAAKHGKMMKGADAISPVLSRDDRFVSKGAGLWDLASREATKESDFLK